MDKSLLASEERLLALLKNGDREAFTQIYESFWERLYRTAFSRLKDPEASEEVVQTLFVSLWERREIMQVDKLENYLVKSVHYAVIDYIRAQLSQDRRLEYYRAYLTGAALSEEEDTYEAAWSQVNQGIEHLPEKTREIFVLYRLKGWTIARLARHYKLSDKAIEYHLTKSLKLLRIYLRNSLYWAVLFFPF